jgi:hypothetical protein
MSKLNETRKAGQRTLIGIAVVGISVYLGFTPLFEKVNGGVTGAVIGSSFGAIFVIILTMYLLNKQTEIEQESKKSEKVFEEKVELYKSMLATTKEILRDGKLSSQETTELSFAMVQMQMVGADETISAFNSVFDKINETFQSTDGDPVDLDDEHKMEILKSLSRFAQKCRVDLGINEAAVNEEIFNATFEEISSAVQGKKDRSKYNFKEHKNLGKGKLVLAVIKDYVDAHPGISFEELVIAFPPDKKFHTSYAIIAKVEEIEEKNHVRYYIKDTDRINLSDTSVAVCNQWGITNIGAFFDVCKKLGIEIK